MNQERLKEEAAELTKLLLELKEKKDDLANSYSEVSERLQETFELMDEESLVVNAGDKWITATLVRSESTSWDEEALQSLLGEDVWSSCQKTVFDEKKLEDLVAEHKIRAEDLSPALLIKGRKPYFRVSSRPTKPKKSETPGSLRSKAKTARRKATPKGSKK